MYYKKEVGNNGEDLTVEFLSNNGYEIIDRNFNCWWGEIDIIAKIKDTIVFVEVKTRNSYKYGQAAEAVTRKKIMHLKKSAQYYLYIKKIRDVFIRFDVVEVYLNENEPRINHIKMAIE